MKIPVELLVTQFGDHLYAAAYNICKNAADAEDVVQDTLIQYHLTSIEFENEEHMKAWLFRVVINKSKNLVRSIWHTRRVSLDENQETIEFTEPRDRTLFDAVMELPLKYRVVIHLFYYEDYNIHEIASILKITNGAVKTRLSRGRQMLKKELQEAWSDDEDE